MSISNTLRGIIIKNYFAFFFFRYFICVGSLEDLNCRGRAIVYQNGGERISVAHRREHQANPLEQQIYDLKWAFFRAVTRTFTEPLNAYARLQVQ